MTEPFDLRFTRVAAEQMEALAGDGHAKEKLNKVRRALGRLQTNPSHTGLNSHKYSSMSGTNGEEVWDSYVENNTPSAWRIFWHYGPGTRVITIVTITPHP
ncbi:UNVERIFIED_ORG: hypothetical protein ABIB21_000780 [Arthrobacter sp. UYEF13]